MVLKVLNWNYTTKVASSLSFELSEVRLVDGCLVVEGGWVDLTAEMNIWAGYTGPTLQSFENAK